MEWFPDYNYKVLGTLIEKGNEQMVIFNLDNALPNVTIKETNEEDGKTKKKKVVVCPEEWGETFGDEFYNFSIDNALYYMPSSLKEGISKKSRPVDGQLSFDLMTETQLYEMAESIKKKAGNDYE